MINNRRQFLKLSAASTVIASSALKPALAVSNTASPIKQVVVLYQYGGVRGGKANWLPQSDMTLVGASSAYEAIKQHCVFFSNCHLTDKKGDLLSFNAANEYAAVSDGRATNGLNYHLAAKDSDFYVNQLFNVSHSSNASSINVTSQMPNLSDVKYINGLADNQPTLLPILQKQLADTNGLLARLQPNIDLQLEALQTELSQQIDRMQQDCDLEQIDMSMLTQQQNMRQVFESMANALACGKQQSISYLQTSYSSNTFGSDGSFGAGISSLKEAVLTGSDEQALAAQNVLDAEVVNFVQQLASKTDLDGNNLLDTTLIVKVSAHGDVKNASMSDAPFMLISGQHLNTNQVVDAQGSHLRVLDTVIDIMNVDKRYYSEQGPLIL